MKVLESNAENWGSQEPEAAVRLSFGIAPGGNNRGLTPSQGVHIPSAQRRRGERARVTQNLVPADETG